MQIVSHVKNNLTETVIENEEVYEIISSVVAETEE